MAKAKQHAVTLTDRQLIKLTRLVGNHTGGSDRDMYNLYLKLSRIAESKFPDEEFLPGREAYTGNEWPVIDLS